MRKKIMLWSYIILCSNQTIACACSRKTTGHFMPSGWQLLTSSCAYAPVFCYKQCCKHPVIPTAIAGITFGAIMPTIITIPFSAGMATGFIGFLGHQKIKKPKQD